MLPVVSATACLAIVFVDAWAKNEQCWADFYFCFLLFARAAFAFCLRSASQADSVCMHCDMGCPWSWHAKPGLCVSHLKCHNACCLNATAKIIIIIIIWNYCLFGWPVAFVFNWVLCSTLQHFARDWQPQLIFTKKCIWYFSCYVCYFQWYATFLCEIYVIGMALSIFCE